MRLAVGDPVQPRRWKPAADIHRTPRGWLVKVELAGVSRDDVEVVGHGRHLIVRGRRCDRECGQAGEFWRMEIRYSEFERTLELPCDLDAAVVTAESRDGMLLVSVECREAP
jgi:HSP20 family protein